MALNQRNETVDGHGADSEQNDRGEHTLDVARALRTHESHTQSLAADDHFADDGAGDREREPRTPVSYTHLTLPTTYSV